MNLEYLLRVAKKPMTLLLFISFIVLSFFYLDKPIAYYFYAYHQQMELFLNGLTFLGWGMTYFILFPLLILFFRYVRINEIWEKRCWFLWLCILFTSMFCGSLKMLLGRARPELLFYQHQYGFFGFNTHSTYFSFPSGHTNIAMSIAFGLCFLFPRYDWVFIFSGLLIAFSRVALTQHYLSDVLVASYLALLEIGLLVWILRSMDKSRRFFKGLLV